MYSCKCLTKKDFFKYFKFLPVSINNLYGDPFFPSQVKNTFEKLRRLEEEGHQGVVSIITKSEISKEMALRLKSFSLNLVILVSISNLSYQIEKVSGNRYKTLFICNKLGIPAIGYIRPFIPNENTQKEKVEEMFSKIAEMGTRSCIVSGLRGNDQILSDIHISKEDKHDWSLRVKTMPKEVKVYISEFKEKYGLFVFDRTSCGVSYALGFSHSYNPYYSSPQLAGCFSCPLKESCFDQQKTFVPEEKDIELAKVLGYQAKMVNLEEFELCTVQSHNRASCVSCCASCFKLKRAAIEIIPFERICLGDTGLLRLLTKKLVFCKGAGILAGRKSLLSQIGNSLTGGGNVLYVDSVLGPIYKEAPFVHEAGTPNGIGAVTLAKAHEVLYQELGDNFLYKHNESLLVEMKAQKEKLIHAGYEVYFLDLDIEKTPVMIIDNKKKSNAETCDLLNKEIEGYRRVFVREGAFCAYRILEKIKPSLCELKNKVQNKKLHPAYSLIRLSAGLINDPEDIKEAVNKLAYINQI